MTRFSSLDTEEEKKKHHNASSPRGHGKGFIVIECASERKDSDWIINTLYGH